MNKIQYQNCFVGSNIIRREDDKLISGKGQFGADIPLPVDTLHTAVLRSEHASAEIKKIDYEKAIKLKGVYLVLTGEDFCKISNPLLSVIRTDFKSWSCAVDRVNYVGEPVH
jgi:2-furoyl-CoA dehydrogenase large subunit